MNNLRKALVASTLIVLAIVSVVVSLPLFGFRSNVKENSIPIVISYPDSMFMPMYGDDSTLCTIKFLLKFNGTLSENTPIEIVNATCMSYVPYNVTITVGFPQGIESRMETDIQKNSTLIISWGGVSVIKFQDSFNPVDHTGFEPLADFHNVDAQFIGTFYFPVSGDFSPIIGIVKQGEIKPIVYTYDQIKVHVLSSTEVDQLNLSQVNTSLSLIVLFFTWVSVISLVYQSWNKKEESQFPIVINIVPEIKATAPETKKPNAITLSSEAPTPRNSESTNPASNENKTTKAPPNSKPLPK
jgi:hypothetical protein